ncbi:Gfo/Idh/MocA family oxidoreductase [Isosphaeraceae bacterium EP7]
MKTVRIGIVGVGFMGMIHYLAAQKVPGAKVAAICSRDPKKLAGDWTGIKGNFGPAGTQMDLTGITGYSDVAELLADPSIDLVDLCVPNDEHAALTIRALEAGKHVLVEKPIALTGADADAMVAAAKSSGKLLMVAHVLPFFPEFAYAFEAVQSGRYGKVLAARFARVISKPDWSSGIADSDRSGGPAIDLHIHDTHFVGLLFGVPRAVASRGVEQQGAVVHLDTHYLYDDSNLAVTSVSGALSQSGRPFMHGYEIYFEKATIFFEFQSVVDGARVSPLTVLHADGTAERPELGSGDPVDGFVAEIGVAVEAVATGTPAPRLAGELARQALILCQAEVESVRRGGAPVEVA